MISKVIDKAKSIGMNDTEIIEIVNLLIGNN